MHAVKDPDCLVSGYLTIIARAQLQLRGIWMKRYNRIEGPLGGSAGWKAITLNVPVLELFSMFLRRSGF